MLRVSDFLKLTPNLIIHTLIVELQQENEKRTLPDPHNM